MATRYDGSNLPTRLLAGDPGNPLAGSAYVRRLGRVVFVPGLLALFVAGLALQHADEFARLVTGAPATPQAISMQFGASSPGGGGAPGGPPGMPQLAIDTTALVTSACIIIVLILIPPVIVWSVLRRAMADWREQLLPQMVLAGQPVEAVLYFPARSYLWAGFAAGVLSQAAVFALPTETGREARLAFSGDHAWMAAGVVVLVLIVSLVFHAIGAWVTTYLFITSRGLMDFLLRTLGWQFIIGWMVFLPVFVVLFLAGIGYGLAEDSPLVLTLGSLGLLTLLVYWMIRRIRRLINRTLDKLRAWEAVFVEQSAGA